MVGSETEYRSKEAVGMMALHEALRSLCLNSEWIYSVYWTIRPRPRLRYGHGCKVGDENGSLMLMWEDGFCRVRESDEMDAIKKAFSKMSIQLYNYGEGLMGKVASDKCHKWIFKEKTHCEPDISNYWQSSFDALPPEWIEQFDSGIQTIAVIQAGHGLLQLGSCKIVPEDLQFVLRVKHTFESLGYQSGFYLSQLFSSSQQPNVSIHPPHFVYQRPIPSTNRMKNLPHFQISNHLGTIMPKDEPVHLPNSSDEIKWPSGLSFVNALTGRTALPFLSEGLNGNRDHDDDLNESLSSNRHSNVDSKLGSSFTLPARIVMSPSATSLDLHHVDSGGYWNQHAM